MKRMSGLVLLAFTSLALFSSCTKEPLDNLTEEESRIYITNRDQTANFSSFKTYSIADSVSVIENNRLTGQQATAWDMQLLSAINSAMTARGYARVSRSQSPDLGINVSRLFNTTTGLVDLGNYYGGYGGYYDPFYWGYGGFGYGFPPAYGLVENTEAALAIDLLDLKNARANQSIKGIWSGLIRGSGIFRSSAVESGVKALFDQSPYLTTAQ